MICIFYIYSCRLLDVIEYVDACRPRQDRTKKFEETQTLRRAMFGEREPRSAISASFAQKLQSLKGR